MYTSAAFASGSTMVSSSIPLTATTHWSIHLGCFRTRSFTWTKVSAVMCSWLYSMNCRSRSTIPATF